ncbi:DMT family transporter [Anoxybacterium hadale]|uniref:DMT family transporter n=1 Tax=Anoxybacterium hadale TaxID=3408580 RepID=A0ACD1AFA1_9FIRM|nr:DMT family transporter [Clostridiales bacterium]
MSSKLRNDFLLFLAALIWGASFVAQRAGMEYIGPFTFNGIRCIVGVLVLIPVILFLDAQSKKRNLSEGVPAISEEEKKARRKTLLIGGLSCGAVLFVASSLQQIGMVYTTAGKGGFITALYIVLVPVLGLLIRRKVRPILWLCVAMGILGLYLLCIKDDFSIGTGDFLVLLCAFGFAIHILVIDYFSPKTDGVKLSCIQFLVCGVASIPFMTLLETVDWPSVFACWLPILYAGVMSCGVAYTLQIVAQKNTEPTVASLILSLESVFALIAGMILLSERITIKEGIGCLIMFAAIILAQLPEKEKHLA